MKSRARQLRKDLTWGNPVGDEIYHQSPQVGLPSSLAVLGELVQLDLGPHKDPVQIEFHTGCFVAVPPTKTNRLHLCLSAATRKELKTWYDADQADYLKAWARDAGGWRADQRYPRVLTCCLARVYRIYYATDKKGDGPSTYVHQMGEERGGVEPYLCLDANGCLYMAGGSYTVEPRGIVN